MQRFFVYLKREHVFGNVWEREWRLFSSWPVGFSTWCVHQNHLWTLKFLHIVLPEINSQSSLVEFLVGNCFGLLWSCPTWFWCTAQVTNHADYTLFSHLTSQSSYETSSVSSVLHMRKMELSVITYLPSQVIQIKLREEIFLMTFKYFKWCLTLIVKKYKSRYVCNLLRCQFGNGYKE